MTKATSYSTGMEAEQTACDFLVKNGYAIIAQRYRNKAGEIDVVAEQNGLLVFIEVKARKSSDEGLYAITPKQQQRIARAAEGFLAGHPCYTQHDMRFDAIIIAPSCLPTHLKHAFMAE